MEEVRFCPEHGFYRGKECKCGKLGEVVLEAEKVEKVGRFMSGILRHFPDRFGLNVDENGWVNFESLVRVLKKKFKWVDKWVVKAIVMSDFRERYEIRGDKIRARYGHSIDIKLNDMPEADEEVLFYGTSEEEAQRIVEVGIKPVNRTFIHLTTSVEKSLEAAKQHSDNPVIFEVDAKTARRDGIKIVKANKFIALAREIPPKYIKRVQYSSYSP
ncbi:MAG: RNA 2'-phosphotransferase [Archaeoglobaceae archaeon]|nr:RNA 2'-phosphotransferase [Archaeoglobaceae archaeon]MCX8151831.1 RNA 2'-phosphotransferase [Archaeoglobaceae archaeon]MDW8014337.1 RNA 2'-phosphotransferase [Archaeoglobaceae archaeon]